MWLEQHKKVISGALVDETLLRPCQKDDDRTNLVGGSGVPEEIGVRKNTVLRAIQHVLPSGCSRMQGGQVAEHGNLNSEYTDLTSWKQPPEWPPDLFAVTGYLLSRAGAYSYILPAASPSDFCCQNRYVNLNPAVVATWQKIGRRWRTIEVGDSSDRIKRVKGTLEHYWSVVFHAINEDLYRIPRREDHKFPQWWEAAHALFVIADEACQNVGWYTTHPDHEWTWVGAFHQQRCANVVSEAYSSSRSSGKHVHLSSKLPSSVAWMADPDVICVQPKSHTAAIGGTTRTFSHNLALLPSRGPVKIQWYPPSIQKEGLENITAPIRILAIPFPFEVNREWFQIEDIAGRKSSWLDTDQSKWLSEGNRSKIIDLIMAIIETAVRDEGQIHGVVLPEDALDWETHEAIVERLAELDVPVEFLISGSSSNCTPSKGNFVLFTRLSKSSKSNSGGTASTVVSTSVSTSRPKHHRWRLDAAQARTYGLKLNDDDDPRALDTSPLGRPILSNDFQEAWEKIDIPQREVHAHVIRSSTIITALICEDLARMDPCHSVIRDIGPNLVISLLFDGPQLANRWSARYASTLSEDPGASVLNLTSRGLIALQNEVILRAPPKDSQMHTSWSVGLWKDDEGRLMELECPPGQHGIVIELHHTDTIERTHDGRTKKSKSWRLKGQPLPISLDDPTKFKDILGVCVKDWKRVLSAMP